MTELYKATYAYDTDKDDELSLKVGETVRVSNKENADWWIAERLDNKTEVGLVPSNFLEKIPVNEGIVLAIVTNDYLAQSSEELSLQKNRIVTVLDRDGEWWKGDMNGKIGIFPSNHVELVEESQAPHEDDTKAKKDAFKLAAYGVKQGGIGSILAGGFSLKRSSTTSARSSVNDRPTSMDSNPELPVAPLIPNKSRPSVSKPTHSVPPPPTINTNLNNAPKNTNNPQQRAIVLHDYNPENEDEIKLMRGEYVTVVDQLDNDGWWKGTSESGGTGVFPSNYVQLLEEEKPPQRPARTRPATVKTESSASVNSSNNNSSDSMARPPPVPVTTRPTSLLSNRETHGSSSTTSSVGSPPPPRPVTTPPRPITTPPRPNAPPPTAPARRANSIITSPPPVDVGHRRIPSIPLMSPDLPPMSPVHERPTRPIPRPTSTTSTDSNPPPPVNPNRSLSPEALNHMAKPPKINLATKNPVIPPRVPSAPSSRPTSVNSEVLPPVPKRSMPPLPETTIVPNNFDQAPVSNTASSSTTTIERKSHSNTALPATPEDPSESLIRQLIKQETDKIRKEFESKLEEERNERLRLQAELDELKASLAT